MTLLIFPNRQQKNGDENTFSIPIDFGHFAITKTLFLMRKNKYAVITKVEFL